MISLNRLFSSNDGQQNTIDSVLDKFRALKLDTSLTAHEFINKFIGLIGYLSTLGEEMPPQNTRNIFLSDMTDPDYENFRTILKIIKSNSLLTECLKDIRERKDYLEYKSIQSRK